jgi:hypothetical protein
MKKIIITPLTLCILMALTFGCSSNSDKEKEEVKNGTIQKEPEKVEEKKSVSEKQALSELKKFIAENKKKFSKYGSLVTVKPSKGDYDGDGLDDFFYTAFFHEDGTEFDLAVYFYRDSKSDEITSLTFDKNNKSILSSEVSNIEVLKISKGSFEANYNVIHPFVAERKFKIKFSINNNIMKLTQKDIKKANDYFNEMDEGFQQGQERWGEIEEEN